MENRGSDADDNDCGHNCSDRKKSDVDRDKEDEDRALDGEAKHIAGLRQHGRIASDRGNDARTSDRLDAQQFRMPDVIHQA